MEINPWSQVGFDANETFRVKMRKFSFVVRKLFRENDWSEECQNEAKFRENHRCWSCILSCLIHFRKNLSFFKIPNFFAFLTSGNRLKQNFAKNTKFLRNDIFFSLQTLIPEIHNTKVLTLVCYRRTEDRTWQYTKWVISRGAGS